MKKNLILSVLIMSLIMISALGVVSAYELDGITFNDDYNPDKGYVAYIQPYDAENQFHSLPEQKIEQYGNPGDEPLGPFSQGQWFDFEYGKAFGSGETKNWARQNYVVTYWWDNEVGDYIPMNGPGGDIYIYQPHEGKRPMGILYQGEWKMFDAGTNGLSDVNGEDFWWDLSDAGVAEGDTIEAIAWWSNALGWPGLRIEKKLADGSKVYPPYPDALDMDGDGLTEALTFPGGGVPMSWHDPFYMGVGNAKFVLPEYDAPEIREITVTPEHPKTTEEVKICANVEDGSEIDSVELGCTSDYHPFTDAIMEDDGTGMYCTEVRFSTWQDTEEMSCEITATDEYGNSNTETVPQFTFDGLEPEAIFDCISTSGDEPLEVTCTSTSSDTVDPDLDHFWDFGDGKTSTEENPTHTYVNDGLYTVSLTVTDDAGHSDTETKVGYIYVLDVGPEASFTEDVHEFNEGETVTFTDTSISHDPILSWLWDFGDGETSTEEDPTHTYADNGVYDVTLTVCDKDNDCDTTDPVIKTVNNEAPDPNAGEYECDEGEEITLTATFVDVAGDGPWIIEWDFDGNDVYDDASGASVSYTCGNGDAFIKDIVTVKVTDKDLDSGYDKAEITINNVPPTANADGPYITAIGETVCLDGSATDVVDTVFTYEWDFDYDGETFYVDSTSENPCTSYSATGVYTVALRATDDYDTSEVVTTTVTVYDYGIVLDAGWNLISIPLVPEDDDTLIENVLEDISDNVEVVWSYAYDVTSDKNVWSYYSDNGVGNLDEIIPGFGYYINMSEEDVLYQNGKRMYGNNEFTVPKPPVVTLTPSWNLIGHYGTVSGLSKAQALTTLNENYATLLDEDGFASLSMDPTEGYWLFLTGTDNLDYAPSSFAYPPL